MFAIRVYIFSLFMIYFNVANPVQETRNYRIATLYHEPFVMPENEENVGFKGLLVDLMSTIAARLKITIDYNMPSDGKYGAKNPNGTWSGIIGELVKQKADIGLAALTITPLRMKVVRFSVPFFTTGIVGLGRKQTFPFGQENVSELLKMAQENKIVLGTLQGGSTVSFFRDSPMTTFTEVDDEMQKRPEGFVQSYDEGISKVRNSKEKDFVFFGEKFILEHAASQEPCDLKVLTAEPLNIINYGIAFAPNVSNKFFEDFNAALLDLQTYGTIRMLKQKWCSTECQNINYAELCTTTAPQITSSSATSSDTYVTEVTKVNELENLMQVSFNDSKPESTNSTPWEWKIYAKFTEE